MDLEKKALSHFDRLVEAGDLLWKENAPRIFDFVAFNVSTKSHPSRYPS